MAREKDQPKKVVKKTAAKPMDDPESLYEETQRKKAKTEESDQSFNEHSGHEATEELEVATGGDKTNDAQQHDAVQMLEAENEDEMSDISDDSDYVSGYIPDDDSDDVDSSL